MYEIWYQVPGDLLHGRRSIANVVAFRGKLSLDDVVLVTSGRLIQI